MLTKRTVKILRRISYILRLKLKINLLKHLSQVNSMAFFLGHGILRKIVEVVPQLLIKKRALTN